MTISERLDSLYAEHPGCRLAAFGDLRTRLVYRTAGQADCPQEVLDQVSGAAARAFTLCDQLPGLDGAEADRVVFLAPTEVRIVVRADTETPDFIFCLCDTAADHAGIAQAARAVLQDMAKAS